LLDLQQKSRDLLSAFLVIVFRSCYSAFWR
jgi:hypothetical protein